MADVERVQVRDSLGKLHEIAESKLLADLVVELLQEGVKVLTLEALHDDVDGVMCLDVVVQLENIAVVALAE